MYISYSTLPPDDIISLDDPIVGQLSSTDIIIFIVAMFPMVIMFILMWLSLFNND